MKKEITRRDFLNGASMAVAGAVLSQCGGAPGEGPAVASGPAPYPPALTGLRGSHDGSWETVHALVSGKTWEADDPEERYDLVVVGGGISGLSAAYFYRKRKPDARILILENHDDFGGHARRNEFEIGGETRIGYGGTESIDTPSAYSQVARDLLVELGIDTSKFYEAYDQKLYSSMGLSKGVLYDAENFDERKLVVGYGKIPWDEFAAQSPLNEQAKNDLIRLQTGTQDYLPGLSREEKIEKLRKMSYETFLRDYAKADPQLLELYRRWGITFWCVGIEEIPALAVQSYNGMPGLEHTIERTGHRGDEPYIFHFPDGNASIARLLVRSLIPGSIPGSTMEDVVTAKVDYSLFDRADASIRIRLSSSVVRAVNTADSKAVDVVYVRGGKTHTVRAENCVLACYNSAIPYLCPEMPQEQKTGLAYNVKAPLCYVKVLVPNWRVFADLGLDFVYYTKDFYKQVELDFPVSIGDYSHAKTPDDPMILHMCHVFYSPDFSGPEQWREGRRRLLGTPFATFEHHVRDQLDQALSGAGFDAGRDIHAITVNRWAHGYAYNPNLTWEPERAPDELKPWEIGRRPFGRIFVANSDADVGPNTKTAIDQAWRAVGEAFDVG